MLPATGAGLVALVRLLLARANTAVVFYAPEPADGAGEGRALLGRLQLELPSVCFVGLARGSADGLLAAAKELEPAVVLQLAGSSAPATQLEQFVSANSFTLVYKLGSPDECRQRRQPANESAWPARARTPNRALGGHERVLLCADAPNRFSASSSWLRMSLRLVPANHTGAPQCQSPRTLPGEQLQLELLQVRPANAIRSLEDYFNIEHPAEDFCVRVCPEQAVRRHGLNALSRSCTSCHSCALCPIGMVAARLCGSRWGGCRERRLAAFSTHWNQYNLFNLILGPGGRPQPWAERLLELASGESFKCALRLVLVLATLATLAGQAAMLRLRYRGKPTRLAAPAWNPHSTASVFATGALALNSWVIFEWYRPAVLAVCCRLHRLLFRLLVSSCVVELASNRQPPLTGRAPHRRAANIRLGLQSSSYAIAILMWLLESLLVTPPKFGSERDWCHQSADESQFVLQLMLCILLTTCLQTSLSGAGFQLANSFRAAVIASMLASSYYYLERDLSSETPTRNALKVFSAFLLASAKLPDRISSPDQLGHRVTASEITTTTVTTTTATTTQLPDIGSDLLIARHEEQHY